MKRRLSRAAIGLVAASLLIASPHQARAVGGRMVIAVIGDYGNCAYSCANEQAVANLVHSWGPNAIFTVGDNSYEGGTALEVPRDQAPYAADVQAGRFFQVTGNHDWGNTCNAAAINPSTAFFGRPPHYVADLGNGLIDFFATDMNCADPGGDSATSAQATWYRSAVAASGAIWKITGEHQAFYSSGHHGTQPYTHWAILPAIDLYLSGHDHDFEHLIESGQHFVVDGAGGRNLTGIGARVPGSVWADASHFGAVRLTVTPDTLTVEFVAVSGLVEHSFQLSKSLAPVVAANASSSRPTTVTVHPLGPAALGLSVPARPTAGDGHLTQSTGTQLRQAAPPVAGFLAGQRLAAFGAAPLVVPPLLILLAGAAFLIYRRTRSA